MTTRDAVPALCPDMLERVKTLEATPAVAAALQVCETEVERAMAEQIHIAEIESPTFAEKVRGEEIMRLMREYGLKDVVMDPSGNVVGRRPGSGAGPTLAIAAHLEVRIMTGTLLAVQQGRFVPEDIPKIIEGKNRKLAGPTAPACGLYLEKVFYEPQI